MTTTVSKEYINLFIDYMMSFYGPGKLYPIQGINRTVIRKATNDHLRMLKIQDREFCNDSIDREQVRDLLLTKYNLQFS